MLTVGFLQIVKNIASSYSQAAATLAPPPIDPQPTSDTAPCEETMQDSCTVCSSSTKKFCAGCKTVLYCSPACQKSHWNSGHKKERKSIDGTKSGSLKSSQKVLFQYEEFVELFSWNKPSLLPPCGLLNSRNNCFANVVLQCLAYTKPLIAFLLERDHRRECRKNDWCFLCEFQTHVERAQSNLNPFSPINILSRLPRMGGNLVYGDQEDAHEFMRFAIDTMQSVCLDEFGGEKAVHPSAQETTLIHHIFGGHLQSQVVCTKCNNVSKRCENIMDLTVEIQGNAASLEDCLDQFTARECLDGDNKYKCDGCNDYVLAWKRLTILQAPNILTIALKRFQSGMFGKLNKRVTFPETLDLGPYMSERAEDECVYKLYGVIVHVDKMNASYFGHYICYIKDFCGKWYRVDDNRVKGVDSDEVLSQGAYMLLYSRISARRSCLDRVETQTEEKQEENMVKEFMADSEDLDEDVEMVEEVPPSVTMQETADPLEQDDDIYVDARESFGENYDAKVKPLIRPGFLKKYPQNAAVPDHVTVATPATIQKLTGNSARNDHNAKVKPLIQPGFFKKQSQKAVDANKQLCCANSLDMNEKAGKKASAKPLMNRGFLDKHR